MNTTGTKTAWDDTIVALATPPGVGAIGVVRLSGPDSFAIVHQLFASKDPARQASHSLHVGYLKDGDEILDEVVLAIYKSPHSYTGEDVAEISAHGSPHILQRIIEACIKKGARIAKPGEFTQRAFLNGKMDLAQAEAVADLIASNSSLSQKAALHNMRGGFSQQLKQLREQLIRFSALIELELDFSQEDVEFADRKQLEDLIHEAGRVTLALLDSFRLGNVIRNGISVAIIGKPNAGKSTLLNALLNEERAIVSEIPGTTRDTIEEVININGILFRLIDTAGIRQHTHDTIESAGVKRSLEKMRQADLVLYLFDVNTMSRDELQELEEDLSGQRIKHLLVANKIDLIDDLQAKHFNKIPNLLFVSALARRHLEDLKQRMAETVLEGKVQAEATVITNARHFNALQKLHEALADVNRGLSAKLPGDLLSIDIRRCLQYLGEITGEITNEDQLDYIFSKFCIGK